MNRDHIAKLFNAGIITESRHRDILAWLDKKPFSVFLELRLLMYAGIVLLTSGLGIAIYKNIDTIGHTVIILLIAAACAGCFFYCLKNKAPYSNEKVYHASPFYDYIVLLGCLLFIALETYLQYQYTIFGTRYGIATLIPAVLFIAVAYYFDHVAILTMGLAALVSFAGITATPGIMFSDTFHEASLIFTGIGIAVIFIGAGYYFKISNIKKHFTFTYYNFGFNLLLISLLSGMFILPQSYIFFVCLLASCYFLSRYAIMEKSFYFLLIPVIYTYIAVTWLLFDIGMGWEFSTYYFVISCIGVIYFLINHKKILNSR